MKNLIWAKITKSLCAAFLIFAICLFAYPETAFAAEVPTEPTQSNQESDPSGKPYRYELEIQYGSFSFYYDWGVWDTETCQYVSKTGTGHSASTVQGQPGWYGFDGTSNKISFTNYSSPEPGVTGEQLTIYARLDYHTNNWKENDVENSFPEVQIPEVTYYANWTKGEGDSKVNEFSNPYAPYTNPQTGQSAYVIPIPYIPKEDGESTLKSTDVYVSFANAPYILDDKTILDENGVAIGGNMYNSEIAAAIGFIQITIGLSQDDLTPSPKN